MDWTGAAAAAEPMFLAASAETPAARLQRVFAHCADGLYRYITVRVGGVRHAADDLIQQVCCEAARQRRVPEADADCEAWLFGIARNHIRKHWRRMSRRRVPVVSENAAIAAQIVSALQKGPLPAEVLARREAVAQLMLAITALPAADQQLLFAFYFDGRSHGEIAEQRGMTAKSVEMRLYRIRSRLREILGEP